MVDIKSRFRQNSRLNTNDISDDTFDSQILPDAIDWLENVIDTTLTVTDNSTDDPLTDRILAEICSYMAYMDYFNHRVDRNTGLFQFEVHRQLAMGLMQNKFPSTVEFNSKAGLYELVDEASDVPYGKFYLADSRDSENDV